MSDIEPFEKLTPEDKEKIEKWVDLYGFRLSHDTPTVDLEYRLREWNRQKAWIFEKFDNNLILEKDIEIEGTHQVFQEELGRQINLFPFYHMLFTQDLFVVPFTVLMMLVDPINLYNNKYSGASTEITINGKTIKVEHNCKVLRVLHKIAKLSKNEEMLQEYDKFATFVSQCSNQRHIKGTLCLSIHPLDYFTASDNDSGWDSCLSWQNHGGYSSGTVAAANDGFIVTAYLKSKNDMTINSKLSWNNKRWREFFVVTPDIITPVKGYPYHNERLEEYCLTWLAELLGYDDKLIYYFDGAGRCKEKDLTISIDFWWLYDDYNRLTEHIGCIGLDTEEFHVSTTVTSDKLICPACGRVYHEGEDRRVCPECEDIYYCEDCDQYYRAEDMVFAEGCMPLCHNCYDCYYHTCSGCGATDIDDDHGYWEDGQFYCQDCYEELFSEQDEDENLESES